MDYKAVTRKKLRGFTLIEMIVVIAIIGILASMLSIAMSVYVRESNVEKQNSNARVVYSTVTDWLIDMEVKNVELTRFCKLVYPSGNPYNFSGNYFEIASRSLIEDSTTFNRADPDELYVSLNKKPPFSGAEFYLKSDLDASTEVSAYQGTTIGANSAYIKEWLVKLGESFPTDFDGAWRAVVNADNYSVFIVYCEDQKYAEIEAPALPQPIPSGYRIFDRKITTTNSYLFPSLEAGGNGYGFDMITQLNNVIADNKNMYGQYPFGPVQDRPIT
jgi:prepilin-type N-terminal cleavage/methylation domain-containing protein